MNTKKQIPKSEWKERLLTISSGNRGRIAFLVADEETITVHLSFRNIEYNPAGKGDDLVIGMGEEQKYLNHIVKSPVEISLQHLPDGEISFIEIVNQKGEITIVKYL